MDAEPTSSRKSRRRWAFGGAILAALLVLDLAQAPSRQISARALLFSIDVYQATLSKVLSRSSVQCRFTPTCSHYGEAAILEHGALKGSALAAWRVVRCGPWTPRGTVEPPPEKKKKVAVSEERKP